MKFISKALFVIVISVFSVISVSALSVDSNNIAIDKGSNKSIDVYANIDSTVTNIDFNLIYSTYDVVANFVVNPSYTDTHSGGIRHGIILGEHQGGKIKLGTIEISVVNNPTVSSGTVSITSASTKNINSETKLLQNQVVNVTINNTVDVVEPTDDENDKEPEQIDYNLLKSIDSDIVDIKLKKDVFKYKITVSKEIKELDLKPVAINDNYKTTISSQKISELKDNKIIIKVSDNKISKDYEINVKIEDKDDLKNEDINESEEKEGTYKYKGKWVVIILMFVPLLLLGICIEKKKK